MASNPLGDYLIILNPSKCGSTWLANTISLRPYLLSPGEFDFIFFLEYPLEKQWNRETAEDAGYLAVRNDPSLSPPRKLERLYQLARQRHPEVRMLIDKSPSNVLAFPRYYHIFRSAHIVVLYRDPRDIYVSLEFFHQHFLKSKPSTTEIGTPDYLLDSSTLWYTVKNVRATLECQRLLERAGIPFLRITYEDMVTDYGSVARKVLDFTGLDIADDTMVVPLDTDISLPLREHIHQGHTNKPLFRKGIVGDWKNYIATRAAKRVIHELAGDLLVELGYERGDDWVRREGIPSGTGRASQSGAPGRGSKGEVPPEQRDGTELRQRRANSTCARNIVVFGFGRSGTTWLAQIIAAAGLELVFEPFNPRAVPQASQMEPFLPLFYRAQDHFPWADMLTDIMEGRVRNEWTHRKLLGDAGNAGIRPERRVIKFIRANLMAEWILAHYPVQGVFIIRNPLGVVASMRKEGWQINPKWIRSLLSGPRFRQPFFESLPEVGNLAGRELTEVEAAAAFWALNNLIPREVGVWERIPLVIYEELCRDPEAIIQSLAPGLGIEVSDTVLEQCHRQSFMTGKQPSGASFNPSITWKRILSHEEVRQVVDVVKRFGLQEFLDGV